MKLFKADAETLYEVPGVPGLVRKPVNLDGAEIGFQSLRSLRQYRFDANTVVNGHAEQDEVFVVVTAGSVEMQIGFTEEVVDGFGTFTLMAPGSASGEEMFVAYLPPHSVYRMTPHTEADVFYARATPSEVRQPAVFPAAPTPLGESVCTLFQNRTHAERLRLRVLCVLPHATSAILPLVEPEDAACEALIYVEGTPATGTVSRGIMEPLALLGPGTIALGPGEAPLLQLQQGNTALVLAVLAC